MAEEDCVKSAGVCEARAVTVPVAAPEAEKVVLGVPEPVELLDFDTRVFADTDGEALSEGKAEGVETF